MNYGLPYMGSKSKLAARICELFPARDNFYDLFCGGGAVTHCAMMRRQFRHYVINDLNPLPVSIFVNAVNGKYRNENRWISREDFFRLKATDEYAACCFSFGNDFRAYCYGRPIEPYKKACHYAIVFDEWELLKELCPEVFESAYNALKGMTDRHARRLAFGPAIVKRLKEIGDWDLVQNNPLYKSCVWRGGKLGAKLKNSQSLKLQSLESLESLERLERLQSLESLESLQSLQSLERLQSLESLERLQRLESFVKDYREITIKPNSVIYCDIPYENTKTYMANKSEGFDYNAFYDWCAKQTEPLFISSYSLPEDKFVTLTSFVHRSTLSAKKNNKVTEKVFVPRHQKAQRQDGYLFDMDSFI